MQIIKDKQFGGERPLFASHDLHIDNVLITEGESAIKKCSAMPCAIKSACWSTARWCLAA